MKKEVLYELIDIHTPKRIHNKLEEESNINTSGLKINHELTDEELENVLIEYPYFQTARLLYTLQLQKNNRKLFIEELSRTALLCADRKKLFYSMQPHNYNEFIKLAENITDNQDRTEELLDSYFKTFSEKPDELNFAPSEYFSYLESLGEESSTMNEDDSQLQHQEIIDAFIEKNESDSLNKISFTKKPANPSGNNEGLTETHNKDDDNEFLTETLAKIYIKQKKYDKALTIIKRLSLNFPKKSAYFADQIRFLEYLIINDKNK